MKQNQKSEKTIKILSLKENSKKFKKAVKEAREQNHSELGIPKDIQKIKFREYLGQDPKKRTKIMEEKEICFSFIPSDSEKKEWIKIGFPKFKHLLKFLKQEYDKLDNFELILFRKSNCDSFYSDNSYKIIKVYVNIDKYLEYAKAINDVVYKLKIVKYGIDIQVDYSVKVPVAFFDKRPITYLPEELNKSHYALIEEIINDVESMPNGTEKKELETLLINSTFAQNVYNNFKKLPSNSATKKLHALIPTLDNLTRKEVEVLLNKILDSKRSEDVTTIISKLPKEHTNKIIEKFSEMAFMYAKYEKLRKSLKEFKILIKKHNNSNKKDEKEIHQFLIKHFWLLGIEYFDKVITSDIDSKKHRTNDTRLEGSRKRPDFIINRVDGFDKCFVIEIEEANDSIFNQNGEFSKKIYDGIIQASDYNLEQKFRNMHSKGIAIIGSINEKKMTIENKIRFKLLREEFPNIEILTYEQIIQKAQSTLDFWKKYEKIKNVDV